MVDSGVWSRSEALNSASCFRFAPRARGSKAVLEPRVEALETFVEVPASEQGVEKGLELRKWSAT